MISLITVLDSRNARDARVGQQNRQKIRDQLKVVSGIIM